MNDDRAQVAKLGQSTLTERLDAERAVMGQDADDLIAAEVKILRLENKHLKADIKFLGIAIDTFYAAAKKAK